MKDYQKHKKVGVQYKCVYSRFEEKKVTPSRPFQHPLALVLLSRNAALKSERWMEQRTT